MEEEYEQLMNIRTGIHLEDIKQKMNVHYNPYEPTPYAALDILFQQYKLDSSDQIVDFGCGKGRLAFYIHYFFHAAVTGVEMSEALYNEAVENKDYYVEQVPDGEEQIQFCCCLAEEYDIHPLDNRFYFFNPFSIQVFYKIIRNILLSMEQSGRDVELVLYYPSEEYIMFLENQTIFELKEEIQLPGLYENNPSEKFLVYWVPY
ncbi:class I SAM-dependent methyltransferase [Bacillus sp. SJS]|uniref:class I SAM-dependent methyltransferase n=1 Tax=Bacillus sp. SJS TaxID=1423321 RepID=UPI0004DD82AC|nr:methyltransferase [Bacillus sp. SJS]KZZ83753.1 SAM-dependent methyltransferase [Bacillus sp. SJS]